MTAAIALCVLTVNPIIVFIVTVDSRASTALARVGEPAFGVSYVRVGRFASVNGGAIERVITWLGAFLSLYAFEFCIGIIFRPCYGVTLILGTLCPSRMFG